MLRAFPMILIAVITYNIMVLGGVASGQPDIAALLDRNISVAMFSGDMWKISLSDVLIAFSVVLLFVEIIKATRTTHREIVNHALSMLTFVGAMAEFLVLKGFGTSAFFFITTLCLFDVVAGYTISIIAAKRDLSMAQRDEY